MNSDRENFTGKNDQKKDNSQNTISLSAFEKYSDQEIWNMFKNNNELAFTHIYSNYVNRLYNFGCQFTSDKELVKDNIQDLFIRLRMSEKKIQVLSIKSYLYKCLYRQLIKKIKSQKITSNINNENDVFEISISIEQRIINTQLDDLKKSSIKKALNELSTKQRQAILLYYYEGMTYEELAQIFQLKSTKSARKLIYRSIDSIRNSVWLKSVEFFFFILISQLA